MAQLDRFLSAMVSHRASALCLDEGTLAELEIAGASRPVTKAPLTAAQVVQLLREVAPPRSRAWSTSRSRSRLASIVMRTCQRDFSRRASIAKAPSSET